MYEGGFGHRGEDCTFETLLKAFRIRDKRAEVLGQIVHDADLFDDGVGRKEGFGIDEIMKGWARQGLGDKELLLPGIQLGALSISSVNRLCGCAQGKYVAVRGRSSHHRWSHSWAWCCAGLFIHRGFRATNQPSSHQDRAHSRHEICLFQEQRAARRILWKRRNRVYRTAATHLWLVARLVTDMTAAALRRWANRSIPIVLTFARSAQSLPDGAIHYIIENGVRLTGMPAWGNGIRHKAMTVGKLVLFVRPWPSTPAGNAQRRVPLLPMLSKPARNATHKSMSIGREGMGGESNEYRPIPICIPMRSFPIWLTTSSNFQGPGRVLHFTVVFTGNVTSQRWAMTTFHCPSGGKS